MKIAIRINLQDLFDGKWWGLKGCQKLKGLETGLFNLSRLRGMFGGLRGVMR